MKMKKIIFITLCITSLLLFTGCNKNQIQQEITYFKYEYGSYGGGYYDYTINSEVGKMIFTAKGYNGVELNISKEINKSKLEELSKIIVDQSIDKWNGFDNSDSNAMDGYSFELKVDYKNGDEITANGYMKYPPNYETAHQKLVSFLESIK